MALFSSASLVGLQPAAALCKPADVTEASVIALNSSFRTAVYSAKSGLTTSSAAKLKSLVALAECYRDVYGGNYRPRHVASAHWSPMLNYITQAKALLASTPIREDIQPKLRLTMQPLAPSTGQMTVMANAALPTPVDVGVIDAGAGSGNGLAPGGLPWPTHPQDLPVETFYTRNRLPILIGAAAVVGLGVGAGIYLSRRGRGKKRGKSK